MDEVVRFRHIGTTKFLALAEDGINLELLSTSNDLRCLFFIRSSSANSKQFKYVDIDGDGIIDNYKTLHSGSKVIVQSFLEEKYL